MAMERRLMVRVGGLRSEFDGSQDHDLALRVTEQASKIIHLPRILYHWRQVGASYSHQKAEACANAATQAVNEQFERLYLPFAARCEELNVRVYSSSVIDIEGDCTLIIDAQGGNCVAWLKRVLKNMTRKPKQIIVAGAAHTMKRVGEREGWLMTEKNASRAQTLNQAAAMAQGNLLVFLAAGVTPKERDWLSEMLLFTRREDVGCVGTRILSPRRRYVHAGYAVNVPDGALSFHAGISYFGVPYMLTDRRVRQVSAVSAAQMAISKGVFEKVGGFDEYESDLMSVDIGLKCRKLGLNNIFTPHAWSNGGRETPCLTHEAPQTDLLRFCQQFGEHPREKYYSPLMEKRTGHMILDLFQREPMP